MKDNSANGKADERFFFPAVARKDSQLASRSNSIQTPTRRTLRHSKENKPLETEGFQNLKNGDSRTSTSCFCPLESKHIGKEQLNVVVSLPIDVVFTLLFVQDQFMTDVYNAKKTIDVTATSWQERDDGEKFRQMTYTMCLPPSNISPKFSNITENQVLLPQTIPGDVYIVESEVLNAGIPYGDAFSVIKHFCLTRQADGKTSVVSWVSIKYKKTLWGFVKNLIEKNTHQGVDGVYQEIASQLEAEAEKMNNPSVGRKRRRAANNASKTRSHSPAQSHASKRTYKPVVSEGGVSRSLFAIAMVIALVSLAIGNVIIYKKLFYLEEIAALGNPKLTMPSMRYIGVERSWDSVTEILHKQQEQHDTQLELWKSKIVKASDSLLEAQEALQWMMEIIQHHKVDSQMVIQEKSEQAKEQWLQAKALKEQQLEDVVREDFTLQSHIPQQQQQQQQH